VLILLVGPAALAAFRRAAFDAPVSFDTPTQHVGGCD
jgi:hypothetical protein